MESQYLEGEVLEEGQEEWLSEGILTDDDYNPASQETEPDSNNASQEDTMNTTSADDSQSHLETSIQNMDTSVSNIEETLNDLENSQSYNQTSDLPEELNAFLIRKMDAKTAGSEALKKESDVDESVKQSDDDGNDTDDLLRVLGDGDQSSKQIKKEKCELKVEHGNTSDEDDNYIFEDRNGKKSLTLKSKVRTFNVAKTILSKAPATKAEPEDDDPTDCSSDEADTLKKMFTFNKSTNSSNITPQISTTVKHNMFTFNKSANSSKITPQISTTVKQNMFTFNKSANSSNITPQISTTVKQNMFTFNKSANSSNITPQISTTVKQNMFTFNKSANSSNITPQISTTVKPGNFTITPLKTKEENFSITPLKTKEENFTITPLKTKEEHFTITPLKTKEEHFTITPLKTKEEHFTITPLKTKEPKKKMVKKVVEVVQTGPKPASIKTKPVEVKRSPESGPRQYINKRVLQGASLLKKNVNSNVARNKKQSGELIDENEFKEEQNIDLNEDFVQKAKENKPSQRLMCPEVMDEDVPTDAESDSDEESLYSELPSSDSDMEDWFTLDIRSERAGEYLPMLGDKGHKLLSEERNRVKTRLDTLKKSLSALSNSGRDLAEQLKEATNTVAELDAMLKVV